MRSDLVGESGTMLSLKQRRRLIHRLYDACVSQGQVSEVALENGEYTDTANVILQFERLVSKYKENVTTYNSIRNKLIYDQMAMDYVDEIRPMVGVSRT